MSAPREAARWESISWETALDLIAECILGYKQNHGTESIVMGYGTGRENEGLYDADFVENDGYGVCPTGRRIPSGEGCIDHLGSKDKIIQAARLFWC